ncbi:peptidase family M48-domain-containing protein [Polychytrium aggregatum]|uniref:peptidase family M48-domain-containing protein n=1 Tax=Polychytrium aggregatum TaxID=110093 RepID=UPI0022FE547D|nr:peptidase family M48-domain-containing protein [Polychytrium aggregatum]KAI9201824.1 peptidase family M48-domain-containing protein [Polychytrium aggregatum]
MFGLGLNSGLSLSGLPLKHLVLGFSFVIFGWENYLAYRQHRRLKETAVPKALGDIVTQETFDKAQAYGRDKSTFSFFSGLYQQLQTTLVFSFDVLPKFWTLAGGCLAYFGLGGNEIAQSIAFLALTSLASTAINMPFSLYYTFVVEEKHGFNKQTLSLYFSDLAKTVLLTGVIGGPLVSAFLWIIKKTGKNFFFYVWLFTLVFQLVFVTIYPTLIQPLFNKFTPLEDGPLKEKIEALSARVKFPLTKLFVVDGSKRSSHSNAYFFGFFKNKRIVLFDTLLEQCNHEEICAVLAHEIGHWKMSHILKILAISQVQLFGIFYLFSRVINHTPLYSAFGFDTKPIIIGFLLFQYIYTPVESISGFLMNLLSRKHEFEADAYGKQLGYADTLKSALVKLQIKNLGNMNPDKMYSAWHYSHPPLVERLEGLAKAE